MKKVLAVLFLILFTGYAWAGSTCVGVSCTTEKTTVNAYGGNAYGGSATIDKGAVQNTNNNLNTNLNSNSNKNDNSNSNSNKNTNTNNISNKNTVTVDPKITSTNKQSQSQAQIQGQQQGQVAVGKVNTEVINPRPLMDTTIVPTVPLPMVQGHIFNYTDNVQNFDGIRKIQNSDIVKSVNVHTYIFNLTRWFGFSKIYLEDVEPLILSLYTDSGNKDKFRYKVLGKDKQESYGLMLGGASGITGNDGLTTGTGAGGMGVASSNADPTFVIYEYQIK